MYTIFFLDDIKVFIKESNVTLFQVLKSFYLQPPHFCYNKHLFIAGNCRICLVEIVGVPKPIVSCAIPLTDNLKVVTESPFAFKARENVLEFLLVNHPLDCPVCDQGGECDLQEFENIYGQSTGRSFFSKSSNSLKTLKQAATRMNRCINCKKCINISHFVGAKPLALFGRSVHSEIHDTTTLFLNKLKDKLHELSENIVDICPVSKQLTL